MRARLTGILLALAMLLSPLAAARAAMEMLAPATRGGVGCCGATCACDNDCPCVRRERDGAPATQSPTASNEGRDARTLLVHVADAARTEPTDPRLTTVQVIRAQHLRCEGHCSGRALLTLISRWTT